MESGRECLGVEATERREAWLRMAGGDMPRAAGHQDHNMLAHNTETFMEKHRTASTW